MASHSSYESSRLITYDAIRIEASIKKSFDNIDYLDQVYYSYSRGEIWLVIVHGHKDPELVFRELVKRAVDLEDELPDAHIVPTILRSSEVEPWHICDVKAVFEKDV